MSEAILKTQLVELLNQTFPTAVVIRHEDRYRHGVPDLSFTLGKTTWFEAKMAHGNVLSGKGIQKVTCLQLEAAADNSFYIIWTARSVKFEESTIIARPSQVHKGTWRQNPLLYQSGHDHEAVVQFIHDFQLTE